MAGLPGVRPWVTGGGGQGTCAQGPLGGCWLWPGTPPPPLALCSSVKCMGKLGTSLLAPRIRVVTSLSACKDEASAKPHLSANH